MSWKKDWSRLLGTATLPLLDCDCIQFVKWMFLRDLLSDLQGPTGDSEGDKEDEEIDDDEKDEEEESEDETTDQQDAKRAQSKTTGMSQTLM